MIRPDSTLNGEVVYLPRRRHVREDDFGTIPEPTTVLAEAAVIRALRRFGALVFLGLLSVALAVGFTGWLLS